MTPQERRERARLRSERWRRARGIMPRLPAQACGLRMVSAEAHSIGGASRPREQAAVLRATLKRCNDACTAIAAKGFATGTFRQFDLHKANYASARIDFELTAQAAVRCIAKVADAFKISRKVAPVFRTDAAQPYDDRILSFKGDDTISIWTLEGRMRLGFVAGQKQRDLLAFRKGEADLCFVRGKWILACPCDIPETEEFKASDWIGVDLGIVSIAATSDAKIYTGTDIERVRAKLNKRRKGLQSRGTKAARKRLVKLSKKQARFQKQGATNGNQTEDTQSTGQISRPNAKPLPCNSAS